MEKKALQQAISEGYKYCYREGDEKGTNLTEVTKDHFDFGPLLLVGKEIIHPGVITPHDLLDLLAERMQSDHEDYLYDEFERITDAVMSIPEEVVKPLISAMQAEFNKIIFFNQTNIELVYADTIS